MYLILRDDMLFSEQSSGRYEQQWRSLLSHCAVPSPTNSALLPACLKNPATIQLFRSGPGVLEHRADRSLFKPGRVTTVLLALSTVVIISFVIGH
jgi:hypothetical protein